jgi:putative membrane protein
VIPGFSDHAANERTFLAWIRTGIAVIAFGFVMEKFNLFLVAVAATASPQIAERVERLAGPFGRYDGLALMLAGIGMIVLSAARYLRTEKLIDAPEVHRAASHRAELLAAGVLALLAASFCVYLVLA